MAEFLETKKYVWSWQQIYGSNTQNYSQTGTGGVTYKYNYKTQTITLNGTATAHFQVYSFGGSIVKGHTYFARMKLLSGSYIGGDPRVMIGGNGNYSVSVAHSPKFINLPVGSGVSDTMQFWFSNGGVANDAVFQVEFFDLTSMFGAGNEPTTKREFILLYPLSYYSYNKLQ